MNMMMSMTRSWVRTEWKTWSMTLTDSCCLIVCDSDMTWHGTICGCSHVLCNGWWTAVVMSCAVLCVRVFYMCVCSMCVCVLYVCVCSMCCAVLCCVCVCVRMYVCVCYMCVCVCMLTRRDAPARSMSLAASLAAERASMRAHSSKWGLNQMKWLWRRKHQIMIITTMIIMMIIMVIIVWQCRQLFILL